MPDTPRTIVDDFAANTIGTAAAPKIVTLSNGNFLVAYSTEIGRGPGFHIRGQQFDASGKKIGGEIQFRFPREIEEREFAIDALPNGQVVISAETKARPFDDFEPDFVAVAYEIDDIRQHDRFRHRPPRKLTRRRIFRRLRLTRAGLEHPTPARTQDALAC